MKEKFKSVGLYTIVFIGAYIIMLLLLVGSALIDSDSVKENFRESADVLCENEPYYYIEKDVSPSRIDRYADSILLNIAYNFDKDKPLESVMWASYYSDDILNQNINFREALDGNLEKNTQYLRYWHGSAVIVKVLHLIMNVRGIYVLHAVILILLTALLVFILVKGGHWKEAVAFILSIIAVSIWYVPFSLEYTWCFLLMLIFSIILVKMSLKEKYKRMGLLFLLSGMVTVYLDFLTTETITLMVPLLFVLSIRKSQNKTECTKKYVMGEARFCLKSGILWFIGYVGMWVAKWLTASVVLGKNVMPYVTGHIEERMGTTLEFSEQIDYIKYIITKSIGCLFPLDYGVGGVMVAAILFIGILYLCFVYRKKTIEWKMIVLFIILSFIPYTRMMALKNHSANHFFFVYRSLMSSVFAFFLIVFLIVDLNLLRKQRR